MDWKQGIVRQLVDKKFFKSQGVRFQILDDGEVNEVYRCTEEETGKSVIIKRAKAENPSIQISDKTKTEAEALKAIHHVDAKKAPMIHWIDEQQGILVLEDLQGYQLFRYSLIHQSLFFHWIQELAIFLAKFYYYHSPFYLNEEEFDKLIQQYTNPMCQRMIDYLFVDLDWDKLKHLCAQTGISFKKIVQSHEQMKATYLSKQDALLHGDLHTSSVMVHSSDIKLFDTEFAFVGPVGFDLGTFLADMLLSQEVHKILGNDVFAKKISSKIQEFWEKFQQEFLLCFQKFGNKNGRKGEEWLKEVEQDLQCFVHVVLLARIAGGYLVQDLVGLSETERKEVELRIMELISRK